MLSVPTLPTDRHTYHLPRLALGVVEVALLACDGLVPAPVWLHPGPVCWPSGLQLPTADPEYLQECDACVHSPSCLHRSRVAPLFRGFDRLAVHDSGTRFSLSTISHSQFGTQCVVDALPHRSEERRGGKESRSRQAAQ